MSQTPANEIGHIHSHNHALTRNQTLVLNALVESEGPLSAYMILDQLRSEGLRAPLQVYRALEKLVELGLVHRLESLNAFVACRHPDCEGHLTVAFAICDGCGLVSEVADGVLTAGLAALAKTQHFDLTKSTVELRGLCQQCQDT